MKQYVVAVAVGLSVAALLAGCGGSAATGSPAAGATGASGGGAGPASTVCATFYADGDLQGASLVAKAPTDDEAKLPVSFNDVMSSVAVTQGCTVTAYADGDFGGQQVTFTETSKTVPPSINDQMSSFKCACH
jgi:hypothetical protein